MAPCTHAPEPHRRPRKRRKPLPSTPLVSRKRSPSHRESCFSMLRLGSLSDAVAFIAALVVILAVSFVNMWHGLDGVIRRDWVLGVGRVPELAVSGKADVVEEMRDDYERRLAMARSLGRGEGVRDFVRWLHVPKCGTSFVNTLLRWGCDVDVGALFVVPRLERPRNMKVVMRESFSWDWLFLNESGREWLRKRCDGRLVSVHPLSGDVHYGLYMHRALTKWEVPKAVALFRLPLQRMYSNYLHLSLHYNETKEAKQTLAQFLTKPKFWSQQTKLLVGRHYRDERVLTDAHGQRAATILRRLRFVGLTEEFQLSCRLYHAIFGGVPHRAQFENVRPGISRYHTPAGRSSAFRYDEGAFNGWKDPADHIVYEAAKRRFWNDVTTRKEEIELDGLGPVIIPEPEK